MLSIILPNKDEPYIREFIMEVERIIPAHEIIVSNDSDGHGKGWAIRQAFRCVRGDKVAFLDGDGDVHPRMLLRLLPFLQDFDAVVGTKRITKAPWTRKVITHLSRIYIRVMFGLPFDTQTGIKLFRRDRLPHWSCDSWLFDVEILSKIKKGGGRIIEVPIEAEITKQIGWRAMWLTFLESLILKFRL